MLASIAAAATSTPLKLFPFGCNRFCRWLLFYLFVLIIEVGTTFLENAIKIHSNVSHSSLPFIHIRFSVSGCHSSLSQSSSSSSKCKSRNSYSSAYCTISVVTKIINDKNPRARRKTWFLAQRTISVYAPSMNDRRVNRILLCDISDTGTCEKKWDRERGRGNRTRIVFRSARPLHSMFGYMWTYAIVPAAASATAHCHGATRLYFNIPFLLYVFLVVVDFVIRSRRLGILCPTRRTQIHENGVRMNQVHAEVDVIVCLCVSPIPRSQTIFVDFYLAFNFDTHTHTKWKEVHGKKAFRTFYRILYRSRLTIRGREELGEGSSERIDWIYIRSSNTMINQTIFGINAIL